MIDDSPKTRRELFREGFAALGTLALTSCASSWYGSRLASGTIGNVKEMIGRSVPPLLLHDANPSSPSFDEYVGPQQYNNSVVLLTFGASWSARSLEQLSELQQVREKNDSLIVMAANGSFNGDWRIADLSRYSFPLLERRGKTTHSLYLLEEGGYTWYAKDEIADNLGPAFAQYVFGVKTFPTTFVIGRDQKVREVFDSLLSKETVDVLIERYD